MRPNIMREIAGDTSPTVSRFTLTTTEWVMVAGVDSRRYCIYFANSESQNMWLAVTPNEELTNGILLGPGMDKTYEIGKYLSLVQGEWYARGDGIGTGHLTVITIPILTA